MDDDSPSPAPKKSGSNQSSANATNNQGEDKPRDERPPRRRQPPRKWFGLTKTQWKETVGILILIPWVWSDFLDCRNFLRLCCLAATLATAQGFLLSFWGLNWKTVSAWLLTLLPIAAIILINAQPAPNPHFTVSFATDDTEAVALTNEYLFQGKLDSVHTNSATSLSFKSFSHVCIIVPIDPLKTNVIFDFEVENDSPVTVYDLSMLVGFSDNLNIGVDSARWKPGAEHFLIPGWKLSYTNVQSWWADDPSPMFPSDTIQFSMTNFGVNLYSNSMSGLLSFTVRSTGFQQAMAANLMFVKKQEGFVKPIVAKIKQETNGQWHIDMTPKELEDSQK